MSGGAFSGVFQPPGEVRQALAPGVGPSASLEGAWIGEGTTKIAWDGEILNRRALCVELGLPPQTALPALLLQGWRKWSQGLLQRLEGSFVLAVCGPDQLLLYRDPSGLKNLYGMRAEDGRVRFFTDLRSHLANATAAPHIRPASLYEYLRFLDIAAPHTLFDGVFAVEAGQARFWSPGQPEAIQLAAAPTVGVRTVSFERAVTELDELLGNAVDLRLGAAARPAAFLSGGLDSALLCALASRRRPDITAVTVGFEGSAHDESPVAARIAAHLGVRHQVLRFSHAQYCDAFERYSAAAGQPMADPAVLATLLAFEHCRSRFDLVLDGTGADEVVGMLPPRHVRLAVYGTSRLPGHVRRLLGRGLRGLPRLTPYAALFDFDHPADTMIRWRGFSRLEIEKLTGSPVSFDDTLFYRTFRNLRREGPFALYSALLMAMPSERLTQASLLTGLPVRYPFCDRALQSHIRQLHTDYRYLPGQPKRILRALLARYVPEPIWNVPKHGFNFPLQEWLAADGHALVHRYLASVVWDKTHLLDPDAVQALARQFVAGDHALTFRVWTLIMLAAWLEAHPSVRRATVADPDCTAQ